MILASAFYRDFFSVFSFFSPHMAPLTPFPRPPPPPSSEVTDSLAEGLQLRLQPLVGLRPLPAVAAGAVGEVQRVVEAAELGVMMPAQVIAFMGDVALVHPGLQVPEVEPHLIVLAEQNNKRQIKSLQSECLVFQKYKKCIK